MSVLLAPNITTSKVRELTIKLDILTHNSAPSLVLLVEGNSDTAALNTPPTNLLDKLLKRLAVEIQPRLQHTALHTLHSLRDDHSLTHTHQLLKALHISSQVGVKVIAVQSGPEGIVGGADELAVQGVELLYGFGERVGRGVGRQNVRGEESQAQAEVGGGEDGKRLDQDVGDGLFAAEVGVELVAGKSSQSYVR